LPLASQLTEEDEKVTKCITEILADALTRPSPVPATNECMKILREDERVLAMLHHQHLLTELEELAQQENMKHRLGQQGSRAAWERGEEEQEDVKKRGSTPTQQKEAASEEMRQENGERKNEERAFREYEKTEEKVTEAGVSQGEEDQAAFEKEAKAVMEGTDEEEEEMRKKKSSSETWSSKEYFGHVKKRGPRQPRIKEVMLHRDADVRKRSGLVKRHFRLEEEEEDNHPEEEPKKYHHQGGNEGHRHDAWEEEEEEEEKRSDLSQRVAEKASDEETAQFEEEEKGVTFSSSQAHLHGDWKPWQEGEAEEKEGGVRHGHHRKPSASDLKKRHQKDAGYPKGRHHGHDEDEDGGEASQNQVEELEALEEIERDLKRAAKKLEELKRG
ncbi:Chromogranin-A, partial [Varanus komodoensis]